MLKTNLQAKVGVVLLHLNHSFENSPIVHTPYHSFPGQSSPPCMYDMKSLDLAVLKFAYTEMHAIWL